MKTAFKAHTPKPCTKAANLFRGAVMAASLIALADASFAQTPQSPQPASSPTPQPSPSPAPPKPPEFKSPFGGNSKPGRGEEEAFSNLVSLYDKWQAAIDSLKKAQACGSKLDIERAKYEAHVAGQDYTVASDQYIRDYSNIVYPPRLEGDAHDRYNIDAAIVTKAVAKASKYVSPPIQACSPHQDTTGNPLPKPEPAPPRPGKPARTGVRERSPGSAPDGQRFSPAAGSPSRLPIIPPVVTAPVYNGPRSGALCPDGSHQIIPSGSNTALPCAPTRAR